MQIADAAVGELAVIQPAIDVTDTVTAMILQTIPRQRCRDLPAIGQAVASRDVGAIKVVAEIFVIARAWRGQFRRRCGEQIEILQIDSETEISTMKRVASDRGEQAGFAAA